MIESLRSTLQSSNCTPLSSWSFTLSAYQAVNVFQRWSLKGLLTGRSMGWSWYVQLFGTSTGCRCFPLSKVTVVISSPLWPLKASKITMAGWFVGNSSVSRTAVTYGTMMLLIISLIVVSIFAQWFGVCQLSKSAGNVYAGWHLSVFFLCKGLAWATFHLSLLPQL